MIMIVCYQEQKTKQTKPQKLDFYKNRALIMGCMEIQDFDPFFPTRGPVVNTATSEQTMVFELMVIK